MTDVQEMTLTEQFRNSATSRKFRDHAMLDSLLSRAADHIDEVEAENERLRAATERL